MAAPPPNPHPAARRAGRSHAPRPDPQSHPDSRLRHVDLGQVRDGLLLLQLMDTIKPGVVDWSKATRKPRNVHAKVINWCAPTPRPSTPSLPLPRATTRPRAPLPWGTGGSSLLPQHTAQQREWRHVPHRAPSLGIAATHTHACRMAARVSVARTRPAHDPLPPHACLPHSPARAATMPCRWASRRSASLWWASQAKTSRTAS